MQETNESIILRTSLAFYVFSDPFFDCDLTWSRNKNDVLAQLYITIESQTLSY